MKYKRDLTALREQYEELTKSSSSTESENEKKIA